jgi:hypothetical protein
MKKTILIKKSQTIGIVLLFIGTWILPSVTSDLVDVAIVFGSTTVSSSESDKKSVEVTVRICGLRGISNHSVLLSEEDEERFDEIFDGLRNKLDKVVGREKFLDVNKEVIIELNKLGLLGNTTMRCILNRAPKVLLNKPYLISGETTNTSFMPHVYRLLNNLLELCYELELWRLAWIIEYSGIFLDVPLYYIFLLWNSLPFYLQGTIALGETYDPPGRGPKSKYPARGWINVQYQNELPHNYTGEMFGKLESIKMLEVGLGVNAYHIGIKGFHGISIKKGGSQYYVGSASQFAINQK